MADTANTILVSIKLADELTAPFDALMTHIDERMAQSSKQAQGAAPADKVQAAHPVTPKVAAHPESEKGGKSPGQKIVDDEKLAGEKAEETGSKLKHATEIGVVGFDALQKSVEGLARLMSGGTISQSIGLFQEARGVEELGKATEEAAEHGGGLMAVLGRIAPVAVGAAAALGGVAAEGAHLAREASEAALGIDSLARISGMSVEKILALRSSMTQGGVDPQELQLALRGLASRVQESWASISDNVRDAADKQSSAVLGVEDAYRSYGSALDEIKEKAIDAAEAQDKLSDAQSGVKSAKFDAEQADIDKSRAEIRWQQLNGQAPDPERVRQLNRREELLRLRRAEERADEAPRKVREAEADEQKAELQPAKAQRQLEAAQEGPAKAAIGIHQAVNAEHDLKRDQIPDIEAGNVDLREVSPSRLLDVMIHRAMTESAGHPELLMQNLMQQIAGFNERAQGNPELAPAATGLIRQFYPRGNPAEMGRGLSHYLKDGTEIEESDQNKKDAALVRNAISQGEKYEEAGARKSNVTDLATMGVGARVTDPVVHAMDALTAGINNGRDKLVSAAGHMADGFDAAGKAIHNFVSSISDERLRFDNRYSEYAKTPQSLDPSAVSYNEASAREKELRPQLQTAERSLLRLTGGSFRPLDDPEYLTAHPEVQRANVQYEQVKDQYSAARGQTNQAEQAIFARMRQEDEEAAKATEKTGGAEGGAQNVKQGGENAKSGLDEVGQKGHEAASALEHLRGAASTAPANEAPKAAPVEGTEGHFLGGPIVLSGHADGGMIRGPGGPRSDSIFRMLNEGDFVIRAGATEQLGHTLLDRINAGAFASGGEVPAFVSDGEFLVKSSAVERYGLPLMHMLNNADSHADGGAIGDIGDTLFSLPGKYSLGGLLPFLSAPLRLADGGDGDNPWTGKHVGKLSDRQWSGVKRQLDAFNHRPDPGPNYAYGEADIPHLPPASAGAPTAKYKPATQGPGKKVEAPLSTAAQAAANVVSHAPGAPAEHSVPKLGDLVHRATAPTNLPALGGALDARAPGGTHQPEAASEHGAAGARLPEVHSGEPPDSVRLPGTLTEHHAKFDADISPSYRRQPTSPTGFDSGNDRPWRPGELGLGGADFYIPEGDKRVLVQTDRAHDKAELRPAGTQSGVRLNRPLFETSDGPGNVTFSNEERPAYGDAETWRKWERGSVSAGTRLSHEDWDRRHPEDNPNAPLFAEGGLIGLPPALRLASGGLAALWDGSNADDEGEPLFGLALGGAAPPGPGMDTDDAGQNGGSFDLGDVTQQLGAMLTSSLSMDSYDSAVGGTQLQGSLGGSGGAPDITGYHALDVTTDKGMISALVSENTLQAMRSAAIGAQITSTGRKPSWLS